MLQCSTFSCYLHYMRLKALIDKFSIIALQTNRNDMFTFCLSSFKLDKQKNAQEAGESWDFIIQTIESVINMWMFLIQFFCVNCENELLCPWWFSKIRWVSVMWSQTWYKVLWKERRHCMIKKNAIFYF